MTGKRILVTGGAGYIGSHVCKALAEAGFEPVTYDNLVYGHREAVRWGPFESGDILDTDRLRAVFDAYQPTAVMHFAAFAYVGESVSQPIKYFRNNVSGAINVIDLASSAGIPFVFSSTCATYGVPEGVPISEWTSQRPINPYGASKLMVERVLADTAAASPLRYAALRYFNAAGADAAGEIGERHEPETHLIPLAIQAALGIGPALKVFGGDYPTRDGTPVRDYIHVTDLAGAHVLALQRLLEGSSNLLLNLGTGAGHSVQEVIAMIEEVGGRPVPCSVAPRREGDPPELVADASLARQSLAWMPRHSSLRNIVETPLRWHQRLSLI